MYLWCRYKCFNLDLELAIEKGMMIAKAELADKVKGEMNKKAKIFTTELGKNTNKVCSNRC